MYRAFVRRQIRSAFAQLSEGNWPALLERMSPEVRHSFPGRTAISGRRQGVDHVRSWFQRLDRVLPGLVFTLHTIAVDGGPLNTRVGVEWTSTAPLPGGGVYENRGAHVLRLSKGRITSFNAYLSDETALTDALQRIADHGNLEAVAAPLT